MGCLVDRRKKPLNPMMPNETIRLPGPNENPKGGPQMIAKESAHADIVVVGGYTL